MLFSFSFRWSLWCCQHARRAHRVGHLSSKSVRVFGLVNVVIEPVGSVSDRPDNMRVSRAPLCVWSWRFSFHDAICVQSCLRKPSRNPPVWRTNCRSPQAEWCLHSCTGSSASHPVQACDLSQAGGWQRSAVCAHPRLPKWFHIASRACLDSKTQLPIVLDV